MQSTSVSLLPRADDEQPRTPSRRSISHSASPSISKDARTLAKTLVVGKNGLYALVPLTFVAQAEALIAKDRLQDALQLAGQIESAGSDAHIVSPVAVLICGPALTLLESTESRTRLRLYSSSIPLPPFDSLPRRFRLIPTIWVRSSTGGEDVCRPSRSLDQFSRRDCYSGRTRIRSISWSYDRWLQ